MLLQQIFACTAQVAEGSSMDHKCSSTYLLQNESDASQSTRTPQGILGAVGVHNAQLGVCKLSFEMFLWYLLGVNLPALGAAYQALGEFFSSTQ